MDGVKAELRAVRPDDVGQLAELLTQLGYPTEEAEAAERLAYWSADPASLLIGADVDGALAGVAALHVCPMLEATGRWARLAALVVDAKHRGMGLGRHLVAAAEARAWEMGCRHMEITSSRRRDGAHRFYRSLGYEDACDRSARFIKDLPR